MSTATLQPTASQDYAAEAANYRALHAGAVVGPLIAVCSLVYPLTVASLTDMQYLLLLAAIPLAALAICVISLRAIQRNSEVYTGGSAAFAGALLAGFCLIGGSAYGGYVFATEVPEGYTRSSFQQMRPSEDDRLAGRPVPVPIGQLISNKEDVFVKGYIRPSSVQYKQGNKEFLLVRDSNECCFGDISKVMYFDQIMVNLKGDLTADYDDRLFRVGGKLSVRPGNAAQDEPLLVYSIEADYLH